MEIINILIFIAFSLAGVFIISFIWASKKGQWDDLDTPAYKMLLDDDDKQKQP